jgi:nucleoside-diphosphate-sugar epimerase
MFSPSTELAGKTVFVTGGLGFLGSVVVEQLLRLTEVRGARNARTAMATASAPALQAAQCAAAGCRIIAGP